MKERARGTCLQLTRPTTTLHHLIWIIVVASLWRFALWWIKFFLARATTALLGETLVAIALH
jgi:hypothetical protein